jgi:hypothetical protein
MPIEAKLHRAEQLAELLRAFPVFLFILIKIIDYVKKMADKSSKHNFFSIEFGTSKVVQ